jgi:hypothetical protein
MCTYNFVTILMAYVIVVTRSIVGEFHLGESSPQQRHIEFGFIRLTSTVIVILVRSGNTGISYCIMARWER